MTAFLRDTAGDYIVKDPDAVLDYSIAWDAWLEGDTIASSSWTVTAGLTKGAEAVNASAVTLNGVRRPASTVATVWLSGGNAGTTYTVTNRIVTAAGRTEDRSFRVKVEAR